MTSVKTYKISGEIRKRGEKLPFHKEVRAVKKEDALQMLYSDIGSRHKARRFEINILNVEEVAEQVTEA